VNFAIGVCYLMLYKDQSSRIFDSPDCQPSTRDSPYVYLSVLAYTESPRMSEVTLVQMSFTNCDIWLALPAGLVTFVEPS
jgi:hypothetical protein